jgi:cbb3-type cytochrome oxidase subunit 3
MIFLRSNPVEIGPGKVIFALVFMLAFIAVLVWSFKKDKPINVKHYGNMGLAALISGGILILVIILKVIFRNLG